jgi:predicted methyltransferase
VTAWKTISLVHLMNCGRIVSGNSSPTKSKENLTKNFLHLPLKSLLPVVNVKIVMGKPGVIGNFYAITFSILCRGGCHLAVSHHARRDSAIANS